VGSAEKDAQSSMAEGLPCSGLCVFCTESLVHGGLYAGCGPSACLNAIDG
jgi:hypothetical protein